jgi:hypothetical protein
LRLKVYNAARMVIYSDQHALIGDTHDSANLRAAVDGELVSKTSLLNDLDEVEGKTFDPRGARGLCAAHVRRRRGGRSRRALPAVRADRAGDRRRHQDLVHGPRRRVAPLLCTHVPHGGSSISAAAAAGDRAALRREAPRVPGQSRPADAAPEPCAADRPARTCGDRGSPARHRRGCSPAGPRPVQGGQRHPWPRDR